MMNHQEEELPTWFSNLSINELSDFTPAIRLLEEHSTLTAEEIGKLLGHELARSVYEVHAYRCGILSPSISSDRLMAVIAPRNLWKEFKDEFHLFLCTNDRKYSKLRKDLQSKGSKTTTVVVSLISASLAQHFGTSAGLIVPFCALCLYTVFKVGVNAYCGLWEKKDNKTIERKAKKTKRSRKDKI